MLKWWAQPCAMGLLGTDLVCTAAGSYNDFSTPLPLATELTVGDPVSRLVCCETSRTCQVASLG